MEILPRCQNHYEVLKIPINASDEEIVEAYKKWARLVHPGIGIDLKLVLNSKSEIQSSILEFFPFR